MRINTYTDSELKIIATMSDKMFADTFSGKSIEKMAALRRLLQMSLTSFSKRNKHDGETQMAIVCKCQLIENYMRPSIMQRHLINIALKYPHETPVRHKELAKAKTEKTLQKMSY